MNNVRLLAGQGRVRPIDAQATHKISGVTLLGGNGTELTRLPGGAELNILPGNSEFPTNFQPIFLNLIFDKNKKCQYYRFNAEPIAQEQFDHGGSAKRDNRGSRSHRESTSSSATYGPHASCDTGDGCFAGQQPSAFQCITQVSVSYILSKNNFKIHHFPKIFKKKKKITFAHCPFAEHLRV